MAAEQGGSPLVEALIERARALDDRDRRALARARGAVDEAFHAGAWRAAVEMVRHRAGAYVDAWVRIGRAVVPARLEELVDLGSAADPAQVAEWQEVARLVRLAVDDALLALLAADAIPPPHVRELYAPWQAMLAAAEERGAGPGG